MIGIENQGKREKSFANQGDSISIVLKVRGGKRRKACK